MTRTIHAFILLAIAAAVAIGGCGGGDNRSSAADGDGGKEKSAPPKEKKRPPFDPLAAPAAMILVGTKTDLGPILIDSAHKTLYYFDKDKRGSGKTTCYGACAETWYPKPSGHRPMARQGAHESLGGKILRSDGIVQATYNGWPLYTNIREGTEKTKNAGKREFGGTWHLLRPNGESAG